MLSKEGRRRRIGVNRALLIPERARVDDPACGIFQLVMDVMVTFLGLLAIYSRVAHCADQLPGSNWISYLNMLSVRVQYLMSKAV
jgi:hypothetical protein